MTITVTIKHSGGPADKAVKVQRGEEQPTLLELGDQRDFTLWDGANLTVSEEAIAIAESDDGGATTNSTGNGGQPPKPPKPETEQE